MGLPGVDLLDLQLWRDLIDEVVAFELPAKPTGRDKNGRRHIRKLRANLRAQGFKARTFFGSMEEVVILGRDRDGSAYSQSQLVTLYNLDFCDEISSLVDTPQTGKQLWRFAAIRQILLDQQSCYDQNQSSGYFVILLTVRDQISISNLLEHFAAPLAESKDYWVSCQQSNPLPTNGFILGTYTWSLKTLIHDQLRKWFESPNISALFFPLVKYNGTPVTRNRDKPLPSPMLHMMVLCRFADLTVANPLSLPDQFLTSASSARAKDDGSLDWDPEPGETGQWLGSPDARAWFTQHSGALITDHRTGVQRLPDGSSSP